MERNKETEIQQHVDVTYESQEQWWPDTANNCGALSTSSSSPDETNGS